MNTLTGTPERVRDRVEQFADIGVEELILAPASLPFALFDPEILDVVAEVILGRDPS